MLKKLFLDLNNFKSNLGSVERGDSIELNIKLLNDEDYSRSKFRLLGAKSDGKSVEQIEGLNLEGKDLKVILEDQFVNCEGIVKLELNVVSGETEITTKEFYFFVSNTMNAEIIDSADSIPTLEKVSKYVDDAVNNLDTLKEASADIALINGEFKENEIKRKANEMLREKNEKSRLQSEDIRITEEEEREANELERIQSENNRKFSENNRKSSENTRVTNERAREEAELNRQSTFEENEEIRNSNENLRIASEQERIKFNNNAKTDELNRKEAEKIRVLAEEERKSSEESRVAAESIRQNTYTDFNESEEERKNNEVKREEAEALRIEAETRRDNLFAEKEKERNTTFIENENIREEAFKISEKTRKDAEKIRIVAESERSKAENLRCDAEKTRISVEEGRITAESARVDAENSRVTAEEARVEADKLRDVKVTEFGKQVDKMADDYDKALANMTNGNESVTNSEIVQARGEEVNLGARIDKIDLNLKRTLNNRSTQKIIQKMINKEPVKIVCYGDSVTYGFIPFGLPNQGNQTETPYPQALQQLLRDYYGYNEIIVLNEGYSGRQSDELASDEYINYVKRHNPDLVVVMVGLNDKLGNFGAISNINFYMNNLKIIYEKLNSYDLLFMTPTPNYSGNGVDGGKLTDAKQKISCNIYKNALINFCSINNVEFLNLNAIVDNYFLKGGFTRIEYQPDCLHYTNEFYSKIAQSIFCYKFFPVENVINEDTYFDCTHGIFRDVTEYFNGVLANNNKYNLVLHPNKNITVELFITKKMGLYLDTMFNTTGGMVNINVNSNTYKVDNNANAIAQNTLVSNDVFICNLEYGYNKIIFNTDVLGFINGIGIKENKFIKKIKENKIENSEGTQSTTYETKTTNINLEKIQHRIYIANLLRGGIGLGTTLYYTDSIKEGSLYYIHFTTDEIQLYKRNGVGLWQLLNKIQDNVNRDFINLKDNVIDIIKEDKKIKLYVNTNLIYESEDLAILGNGDIYLTNFFNSLNEGKHLSILKDVKTFDYNLGTKNYEGEEVFSYEENKNKVFRNSIWI